MTRDQLETRQIPLYLVTVVAAIALGLLAPRVGDRLETLVTPAIAVLMYAMFLQIPFLDLRQSLANRRFIAALLLANFVLVPLLVWAITRPLTAHPALLIGALLVLLTPCIDYVVVFTHLGRGDARSTLAATPLLLVLQLLLLPLYLSLMLDDGHDVALSVAPFVEAFVLLIVLPLALAVLSHLGARRARPIERWCTAWGWMPVPAMALVLLAVIGSQIATLAQDAARLLPLLPVYLGFMLIAPCLGWGCARLLQLPVEASRSVSFSAATRNSLVVLPLALALPEELRALAAAAVICQTLVELLGELIYIRLIPTLVR
ncbi:arsenic resistance protein [Pseudomonas sp. S75]|uniref:arsenic resistance protein n=1 Tax=unclassified Pseudomonas TaxID=196821 RepID=UPI001903E04D|nr:MULTISPECIES: bile acid:sodium symporter [unclassified Pseudomonas]MBJ9978123.1 arsenic resistance protein [Pseudomonas sp. S30]MBK0155954.1 arsenic resistance protein [Pseudomonas sp. S75]